MEDGWDHPPPPARRRWPAALGAVVVVVVGARLAAPPAVVPEGTIDVAQASESPEPTRSPRPRPSRSPRPSPTPTPTAAGSWSVLEPAPIVARDDAEVAWTGRELLVWGGERYPTMAGERSQLPGDGAALDPVASTWRPLPPAPLSPRAGTASAWTGTEFVVWGGRSATELHSDGAAYDPAHDRWRPVAAGPLSPRSNALGVALGGRALLFGGDDLIGMHADAATWDPATDAWGTIEGLPTSGWHVSAVASAAATYLASAGTTPAGEVVGLTMTRIDAASGVVTALPPLRYDEAVTALLVPDGIVVLGRRYNPGPRDLRLSLLRDGATSWTDLDVRLPDVHTATAAGDRFYLGEGGQAFVVGADGSGLARMPPPPRFRAEFGSRAFWTGDRLVLISGMSQASRGSADAIHAAVWTPAG